MLLPWGHENGPLPRRPWVTLALIVACIATLVSTRFDPAVQQFGAMMDEAYAFWSAHPYLEPGDLLAGHFGDEGAEARAEFQAAIASGEVPIPKAALEAEQAQLDRLADDASSSMESHVWYRFGFVPSAPRLQGVLGHLFLHAGWAHLAGNLLFLLLTGPFLESRWGRSAYLLFYLGAGVAAASMFAWRDPFGTSPLIGASGAIAGAMGAFLVVFATMRIKFAYWLGLFWGTFAVPAWLIMPLWFAHELASARLMDLHGASDGIAYWAHVGGFTFGAAVAGLFRVTGIDARLAGEAVQREEVAEAPEHTPVVDADQQQSGPARLWAAVARADRPAALQLWKALQASDPAIAAGPPDGTLRLAGWLQARGQSASAGRLLGELLTNADEDVAGRIARVAARIDPDLARRAASMAGLPTPAAAPARAPAPRSAPAAPRVEAEAAAAGATASDALPPRDTPSETPEPPAEAPGAIDRGIEIDRGIDIDLTQDSPPPVEQSPSAVPEAFDLPPDFEDGLAVPDDLSLDDAAEDLGALEGPGARPPDPDPHDRTQIDLGPSEDRAGASLDLLSAPASAPPPASDDAQAFDRTQIDLEVANLEAASAPPASAAPAAAPGAHELFETDAVDLTEKEDVALEFANDDLALDAPGAPAGDADAELFDAEAFDLGDDDPS